MAMLPKLPFEILFEIANIGQFSREELLACRLICRRLCAVFTPYAFRTVRTNGFDRVSFDRLCSIAQTPHLARHVVEYEYRLVPILQPLSHHEVDILLPSLSLAEPRAPSGEGGQPTVIPCDDQSETMDVIAYTQNLHKNHQKYLRQQDVLGTFYDTLSILQSLPLFSRLQTIRILDFEVPPKEYDNENSTNTEAYNTTHITAIVRAVYSIAKTLRFLRISALPELKCWEIERFDYEVFYSHIPPPIHNELDEQFHLALCRVSILKIHKLTSGKVNKDIELYLAPYSLVDELMQGDLALEELTLSDGRGTDIPRHYRYQKVTFPWGPQPRVSYDDGRIDYSGLERCLFPQLRKLDLSGHRSLDLLNFAGMLYFLTPGILKELVLESLGMDNGQWEDLFRIIAPKKKWRKKKRIWPGEHIHATVQSFFSDHKWAQEDVAGLKGLVDNSRILDENGNKKLPRADRKLLWKGLQLEKFQLKHLCYWGSDVTADGFQRFPLSTRQENTFCRWMMDGLDEEQYNALFLPWHV